MLDYSPVQKKSYKAQRKPINDLLYTPQGDWVIRFVSHMPSKVVQNTMNKSVIMLYILNSLYNDDKNK